MSDRLVRNATAAALAVTLVLVLLVAQPSAQGDSEQEIMRLIKENVFDENWEAVLAGAEKLIASYPNSPSLARTMYYRARALQKLGRDTEAVVAYGEFIDRFPDETLLREDALISRMGLAKSMYMDGKKEVIRILLDGLEEKGYPRIYDAIQISFLDHRPGQKRALPVLKECAGSEDEDAEVRNECTLALLRMGAAPPAPPSPPAPPAPPDAPAAPGAPGEPKLIRLQVRDKATDKITVAVNLPIAFAEALLQSLDEIDQGEVVAELKARGYDINNLWKSLRTLGKQTLVEIETEEARIKVWLE